MKIKNSKEHDKHFYYKCASFGSNCSSNIQDKQMIVPSTMKDEAIWIKELDHRQKLEKAIISTKKEESMNMLPHGLAGRLRLY